MDFGILVLISGRGSNLKSLISNAKSYKIIGVLSNNPEAPGLEAARDAGIKTFAMARHAYPSVAALKDAVFQKCVELKPDLVALAGFMQIIQPDFVSAFEGRMVNIHPALLPKFPGLHTHQRALEAGEPVHGCTVHFVDSGVDTGPIIAQASCPCLSTDTEESLASRVLTLEHRLYPWVVNNLASGRIGLNGKSVRYAEASVQEAHASGFVLPEYGHY